MRNIFPKFKAVAAVTIFIAAQFTLLSLGASHKVASAQPESSGFAHIIEREDAVDLRVIKLEQYLTKRKSPMAPYASAFVASADRHGLDYRLVAAISGIESGFGKHVPSNSYNAYGWANGSLRFKNWEDGIETVSVGLRQNYLNRGRTTVSEISYVYVPPNHVKWTYAVNQFMNEIEAEEVPMTIFEAKVEVAQR